MIPQLPAELWTQIVRYAITNWPHTSFNLLADDFNSVQGFSGASKFTRDIVEGLRHENLVLEDYDDFIFLWIPCLAVRYARSILTFHIPHKLTCPLFSHLRINETLPSRQMFTGCFYNTLSDYSQLESLSLCTPEPAYTCSKLPHLSFATTLRRLDLRCKRSQCKTFWDTVSVSLPNLIELRLGASEFLEPESTSPFHRNRSQVLRKNLYTDVETFAVRYFNPLSVFWCSLRDIIEQTSLAERLSRSQKLRFLSLHILLSDAESEDGFFGFFTTKTTGRNENAAALILARTLGNLRAVCWGNPWNSEEYEYVALL